jgi:hypothetical protein
MYINLHGMPNRGTPDHWEESLNGKEFAAGFEVRFEDNRHAGSLHISKDKTGTGTIEWCKNEYVRGAGIEITVKELIEYLESRATQN